MPTGQPRRQVERAITRSGAGSVTTARKPVPGSAGIASPVFQRLTRMIDGVGRTSPYPSAVVGSTRVPSHGGGLVPSEAGGVVVGVGSGTARLVG